MKVDIMLKGFEGRKNQDKCKTQSRLLLKTSNKKLVHNKATMNIWTVLQTPAIPVGKGLGTTRSCTRIQNVADSVNMIAVDICQRTQSVGQNQDTWKKDEHKGERVTLGRQMWGCCPLASCIGVCWYSFSFLGRSILKVGLILNSFAVVQLSLNFRVDSL